MIVGTVSTLALIALSPAVQVDLLGNASAVFPLKNPALVTIPLSFIVGVVGSLLRPNQLEREKYDQIQGRVLMGAD